MVVNGTCESDWPAVADLGQAPRLRAAELRAASVVRPRALAGIGWPKLGQQLDDLPKPPSAKSASTAGSPAWTTTGRRRFSPPNFASPPSAISRRAFTVSKLGDGCTSYSATARCPSAVFCCTATVARRKWLSRWPSSARTSASPVPSRTNAKRASATPSAKCRPTDCSSRPTPPTKRLPENRVTHPLGQAVNHPANIAAVYEATAEALGQAPDDLARRVEENFVRLFGG